MTKSPAQKIEEARSRQIALEAKTGVKWDFYTMAGGKYRFTPVISRDTLTITPTEAQVNKILAVLPKPNTLGNGLGFEDLSKLTKISLAELIPFALYMVKNHIVRPQVNRLGHAASIYRPLI